MSRLDDALMRLYENADVRDELTDEEADMLLKWAEAEITRLDAAAPDEDAFTTQVDTLMKLLKQINRYAGRQGQGLAEQSFAAQNLENAPDNIAALAGTLGHVADATQVAAAATGEPGSTVGALTALLTAPSSAASPSPAPQLPVPGDETAQPPSETTLHGDSAEN